MSQEVASPTNAVSANSGGVFGRKSGRSALIDSDPAGSLGGFGAILANMDEGPPATEDADKTRDRQRKSSDASANLAVPTATHPEDAQPSSADIFAGASAKAVSVEDRPSESLERGSTGNEVPVVVVEPPISDSIDLSLLKGAPNLEGSSLYSDVMTADTGGDLSAEALVDFAARAAQEASLVAPNTSNPSAALGAGNSSLAASRLLGRLAGASTKLAQNASIDQLAQSHGDTPATGLATRVDDGGFRARIALEIKLLTQQSSLTPETVDSQQYAVPELGLPRFTRANTELSWAPSTPQNDASGQGSDMDAPYTAGGASTPADGFLATATDLENNDSYWISGDLKNAKMMLGDASEGLVEVSISLQGNQAQVAFRADETSTRNALQDSGSELKEMLRRDGIELAGVSVGSSGAGGGNSRGSAGSEDRRTIRLPERNTNADDPSLASLPGDAQGLDLFV